jgi:LDH2 family malate/lactate/ureidoglycolate dehydrogenase
MGKPPAMANYPGSETERRFSWDKLRGLVDEIFVATGMSQDDANEIADSLVAADQRGIHSHGTLRVPEYVEKLTAGGVNPRGRPRVASCIGGAIIVDGDNAMGQVVAAFAMRAAIDRAREMKVAFAAVRGSNHCGALDRWVLRAAREGMVGLASTNALPTMAPWGGRDKIIGMNPFAAAFPAGEEPPIVLDTAFGATAHGKIRVYHQKGRQIPEGWAYDEQGRPTTDPVVAMSGLIQPIGEHKGIGLAVVMGMLSSLLSGASYGTELGDMTAGPKPGHDGHFFAALEISAFQPLDEVKARVDSISRQIQQSGSTDSSTRLYPPGLLEAEFESSYERDGIPLNEATVEGIRSAARKMGLHSEVLG